MYPRCHLTPPEKRLCREALVWRQLRHPNVLPFIGLDARTFPYNNLPALLSPWMEHGTLREYIQRPAYDAKKEIPPLVCLWLSSDSAHADHQICVQLDGIAQGIAYLHSLAIAHGDIKHVSTPTVSLQKQARSQTSL
jgi:serine/threonine protein kinase